MASKRRYVNPGHVYHIMNRGAERRRLFFQDSDYQNFEPLVQETFDRVPLTIYSYQLMPNHWHFVARPKDKVELSEFFQYLAGTLAKRFRVFRNTVGDGHVYQDRFKSFPVESDKHFLSLVRYVERNAKRAGLVERAEDWKWGGLWQRTHVAAPWLNLDWPVQFHGDWIERVNAALTQPELDAIGQSLRRGRPYGSSEWVARTARESGLRHTLRPPGRPRLVAV